MRLDVDGEFAGAGAEEVAADADVVAEVEELVEGEGLLADVVFADVDLEALAVLLDLAKPALPWTRMAMMRPATAASMCMRSRSSVERCSPRARSSGTEVVEVKQLGYLAS